jgi:DNA polymerase-3 subunit delta
MRLNANQLGRHLEQGLAPLYLISGDEPLLVDEACAAVRARARALGYERQVATVEAGFDWHDFAAALSSPSLFATRSLHELRLPTAKPGDTGAKMLVRLAELSPPDTVLLVITGKLDKATQQSKWASALEDAGVHVQIWPLEPARLPEWIAERLRTRGLKAEPAVAELLAQYTEGNLLAAAQEIDKFALLFGEGAIRLADVRDDLSDDTRFTVYGLADACLAGDAAGMLRILTRLRTEGTEPILALWALAREARALTQMALLLADGKSEAAVMQTFRVWQQRKTLVGRALKRLSARQCLGLLVRAAQVDKVLKGRASGDGWHELELLALAFCGVRLAKSA